MIYVHPNKQAAPSFNQIAKYEIENALPNMAPPWPPTSANIGSSKITENPEATESPKTAEYPDTTKNKIVFAGDYTVNGSIDGALQSGPTAARQILGPHQILNPRQTLGERATA
jgi:hypothetical protein